MATLRLFARSSSLLALLLLLPAGAATQSGPPAGGSSWDSLAPLPLAFVENAGQWEPSVLFAAHRGAMRAEVHPDGLRLRWAEIEEPSGAELSEGRLHPGPSAEARLRGVVLDLRFEDAAPGATAIGLGELPGRSHFLLGRDEGAWVRDARGFEGVRLSGARPGVDLDLRPEGAGLKYDLVLAPGASVESVVMTLRGAETLSVEADGSLVARTPLGTLRQPAPATFEIDGAGARRSVEARFRLLGGDRFGFDVPHRDPSRRLVIDPGLVYATLLHGSLSDVALGVAVDAAGSAYVTGWTVSPSIGATPGAFQTTAKGSLDAFVAKLNPTGTALVYSTYLGGSGGDQGVSVAVDGAGNATVVGSTLSPNFPVTTGAFQTLWKFGVEVGDGFCAKLNAAGSGLVYSTLLGGTGEDIALRVAVDGAGAAHVAGWTRSFDFPTTAGAFQTAYGGTTKNQLGDAFVTKVSPTGAALLWSSFLGGPGADAAAGIAIGPSGTILVTGVARELFPITIGSFSNLYFGNGDVFVARFDPSKAGNASIVYATLAGGGGADFGYGIAADATGNAFVCGYTESFGSFPFPTTAGAFDTGYNGTGDAFVMRLSANGATLGWSTLLGGSGNDVAISLALDAAGAPYVAGHTSSKNFPVTAGAFQSKHGGKTDAFLTKLSSTGQVVLSSTLFGGIGFEQSFGLALRGANDVFLAGSTDSTNFPDTPGAIDGVLSGRDAWVARFDAGPVPILCVDSNALVRADWFVGEPAPESATRTVTNCGSPTSLLLWEAFEVEDAPWLQASPAQGALLQGAVGTNVQLAFDPVGLATGAHEATVRLRNTLEPTSFVDLPVLLTVQEDSLVPFVPGDRLEGSILFGGEIDDGSFEGLALESVTFAVASADLADDLRPVVSVFDAGGTMLKSWKHAHSTKASKRTLKLPADGLYRLRIEGELPTRGAWTIETSRKVPAKAKPVAKKTIGPKKNGLPAEFPVALVAGGSFSFTASPLKTITGPLALALLDPDGDPVATAAFESPFETGGLQWTGVPVGRTGMHTVRVTGLATTKEKVKISSTPAPPPSGSVVVVP